MTVSGGGKERFSRGEFSTQLSKGYAHCIVYVVSDNIAMLSLGGGKFSDLTSPIMSRALQNTVRINVTPTGVWLVGACLK